MLIDPEGNVAEHHAGEGVFEVFDERIARMIERFEARGTLSRAPLDLNAPRASQPDSPLRFPGKVLADEAGERLFIADTNHNRIVVTTLSGRVLQVIGSGEAGLSDGEVAEARFRRPQGLTLAGPNVLFVADTGNHSVRRVDLAAGEVSTVAGTGEQQYMFSFREAPARGTGLNSPWDVLFQGGQLYIAMAGQHQLWRYDPGEEMLYLHAGSGREALQDGPLQRAGLNQPSGLATNGEYLFVADSEASAVREAALEQGGLLTTLVGRGLFDFGDVDGRGAGVRLQHPKGISFHGGFIYVADTYNNKIKRLDPETLETVTFLGTGARGWRDGSEALFYEPSGVSAAGHSLFIADTNNHAIRVADLNSGEVRTLQLSDDLGLLARPSAGEFFGTTVALEEQRVAVGDGRLLLEITLPKAYKVNDLAPLAIDWRSDGRAVTVDPSNSSERVSSPEYPLTLEFPAYFVAGQATVTAELNIYYCREGAEALCLVDRVRLVAPVTVADGGESTLRFNREPPPVPE